MRPWFSRPGATQGAGRPVPGRSKGSPAGPEAGSEKRNLDTYDAACYECVGTILLVRSPPGWNIKE